MHPVMAATLETVVREIGKIQDDARRNGFRERPRWPMIVLRSPKGWTCPAEIDGKHIRICEASRRDDRVLPGTATGDEDARRSRLDTRELGGGKQLAHDRSERRGIEIGLRAQPARIRILLVLGAHRGRHRVGRFAERCDAGGELALFQRFYDLPLRERSERCACQRLRDPFSTRQRVQRAISRMQGTGVDIGRVHS